MRYGGIKFFKNIDGGTALVTLTNTTLAQDVFTAKPIDTYSILNESWTFWFTLEDNYEYSITVTNGGGGSISISDYIINESLTPSKVENELYFYHSDHENYVKQFTKNEDEITFDLLNTRIINCDGINASFILDNTDRAYAPKRFGHKPTAGNLIWYQPEDPDLTWGSNAPDYDDEIIDANGYFGVKFYTPPSAGDVYIEYTIKADSYKVITKLKSAESIDQTYVDTRKDFRLLDQAIEVI